MMLKTYVEKYVFLTNTERNENKMQIRDKNEQVKYICEYIIFNWEKLSRELKSNLGTNE